MDITHLLSSLNSLNAALLIYDAEKKLQVWNDHTFELYPDLRSIIYRGMSFEQLTATLISLNYHSTYPEHRADITSPLLTHHQQKHHEEIIKLPQRTLYLQHNQTPEGGIISLHTDITGYHQITATKSWSLANISHEIRTPMNGLLAMTELCLDTSLDNVQRDYLTMAHSSAQSLLQIINDILDLSKIEAGKMTLEMEELALRPFIQQICYPLMAAIKTKPLELVIDIGSDLPATIICDPQRLRQILSNLLSNALKFTQQGEIIIKIARSADDLHQLTFSISDSGIGIALDKQAVIFESFRQGDSSTTRKYGGTGLGLTISDHLVTMLGGKLRVKSQPEIGSTFYFSLPIQRNTVTDVAMTPLCQKLNQLPVLIVDDNQTQRDVLSNMLSCMGFLTTAVSSGQEALNILQTNPHFPLILVDEQMPEMDGITLALQIKATPSLAPSVLIMLCSLNQPIDIHYFKTIGVASYLIKPIVQTKLFETIRQAMSPLSTVINTHPSPMPTLVPPIKHTAILLAEDNTINQQVAIHFLNKLGYPNIDIVNNGLSALDKSHQKTYQLMLFDVQMPEMDGDEVMRLIRQDELISGHHQHIIAMTAHAMPGDREKYLQHGFDDYISKPISLEKLQQALDKVPHQINKINTDPSSMLFDSQQALQRFGGDKELLLELITIFITETPQILEQLNQSTQNSDFTSIRRLAHKLKGEVLNFSESTLVVTLIALEQAAQDEDPRQIDIENNRLKILYYHLSNQLRQLRL